MISAGGDKLRSVLRCALSWNAMCVSIALIFVAVYVAGTISGWDLDLIVATVTSQFPKRYPTVPQVPTESVEYYEQKLVDPEFRWNGPTSAEDRIPVLHAARALAYIGDPAVPVLLRAMTHEPFEDAIFDRHYRVSLMDALSEIGLPAHEYRASFNSRNPEPLARWWDENRLKTKSNRSEHRRLIGLPPVDN